VDIQKLDQVFDTMNFILLIPAVLFFVLSKIVSAYRLNYFLRDEMVTIPESFNLKLYLLGMYYNLFLPGGIGGDGYKIYLLNKLTGIKAKYIFRAVLMDRITGVFALLCISLVLSGYLPLSFYLKGLFFASVPLVLFLFYLLIRKYFRQYLNSFTSTNLQAFVVQLLQVVSAWYIIRSLGIRSDQGMYLFVFLLSSIVAIIPFTIGGAGARELTFVMSAGLLGLHEERSLGISLIFFLITAIVSLAGVYYSFRLEKPADSLSHMPL
jgi:hypothetical protein